MIHPSFILHVYKDDRPALLLLRQIRYLYPEACIAAILDGVRPKGFAEVCDRYHVLVIEGDRLKLPQYGGAWLKRMLEIAQVLPGDVTIKLDPDSWLWRRFNYFPQSELFGTCRPYHPRQIVMVRGGCQGWSNGAIDRVLDSGILDDPRYCSEYFSYEKHGERLMAADYIVGDLIARLGLSFADWDECRVDSLDERVRRLVPGVSAGVGWAATHPHRAKSPPG